MAQQCSSQVKILGGRAWEKVTPWPIFSIVQNCLAMQNVTYGVNPSQMCLYEPSSSDYQLYLRWMAENE